MVTFVFFGREISFWQIADIFLPGFIVNGQIIGKKKVIRQDDISTYFGRFGILHESLGVKLEVSTQDISVFHNGKQVKLQWSDQVSLKEAK